MKEAHSNRMRTTIAGLIHHHATGLSANSFALAAPGRKAMTYGQLDDHLRQVGQQLREMGIGRHDHVAVVLPNGPEMAGAFLTISASVSCAPLNPAFSARDFDFYLDDLGATAVVVSSHVDSLVREVARDRGITLLELSAKADAPAGSFELAPQQIGKPAVADKADTDDVALLLHTSGTTSRPKMVPLTHYNLVDPACQNAELFSLTENDVCLNVMPLFHGHGLVTAVLTSIAAGSCVICTPGFDRENFYDWLRDLTPTWYTAVPTVHQAVLAASFGRERIRSDHRLRFIHSISAALPPPVMRELEDTFGVPIVETYGLTECMLICGNRLSPGHRKPGSVGPAAGQDVAIMDSDGRLLASDQIGEVVTRGRRVMAGYRNNPEANEAAFHVGWFRTGDRGRMDADRHLFLSGRIKEIIERGGEKIAPQEVEEVLLEHSGVAQAAAFAVPHPSLGEDLIAAVVLRNGVFVTESELREFLFGRLSDFKIPTRIIVADEIPKGPTGKLQRADLYKRFGDRLQSDYVEPHNILEKEVARIWCEVLRLDRVGSHDNFFSLGGDSLSGTRVVNRLVAEIDIKLPVSILFQKPTIAELVAAIEKYLGLAYS